MAIDEDLGVGRTVGPHDVSGDANASANRVAMTPGHRAVAGAPSAGMAVSATRPDHARRPVVVILGMHRSGTSLLSNIVHYVGCDMADDTDAVSPKNPGGFWERPGIVAIHDAILAAIGRSVGDPRHVLPFPAGWWRQKEVQALKGKLIDLVRAQLAGTDGLWGFKDPRTCRLLPLWNEIFRVLHLEPVYLYALRSPEPSARSMTLQILKPRPVSAELSELMWLAYNFDTVRHTAGHDMLVIDYDDWFVAPERIMDALTAYLPLDERPSRHECAEIAHALVAPGYRNETDTAEGQRRRTIARGFYEQVRRTPDLRTDQAVRGQLPFIELMFRTVAPTVERLADIPGLEAQIVELEQRRAQVIELKAERARLGAAIERFETDDAAGRLKTAEARLVELDQRRTQVIELKAERARLSAAVERFEADDMVGRLKAAEAELSDADRRLAKRKAEAAVAEATIARLGDELASMQNERDAERLAGMPTMTASDADADGALARRIAIDRLRILDLKAALAAASAGSNDGGPARDEPADDRPADAIQPALHPLLTSARPAGLTGSARFVEAGIDGIVSGMEGPPLMISARVDGRTIADVLTVSEPAPSPEAPSPGTFFIPWSAFPLDARGRPLALQILGTAVTIDAPGPVPDLANGRLRVESGRKDDLDAWLLRHHGLSGSDHDAASRHYRDRIAEWPLVSILLLDADRDMEAVRRSTASLMAQIYDQWELVVTASDALPAFDDPRIRIVDATDMASLAAAADGSFAGFLTAGDRLAADALLATMTAVRDSASPIDLIYTDEDRFDPLAGSRSDPYFKGAWSHDLMLAQPYAMRFAVLPASTLRSHATGGANEPGAYATVLHALANGTTNGTGGSVLHLPHILYHRDRDARTDSPAFHQARLAALADVLPAVIVDGTPDRPRIKWPLPLPLPRVSVVIPTRDRLDLLAPCIEGLLDRTSYSDLEILIVDNQSVEPETLAYFQRIERDPRVTILQWNAPFDYSAINNRAVEQATGSIIALLNNDIVVREPTWLTDMVRHAVRGDVGIVGARLLYGDGSLQHAGVVLGIGTASHLYKGLDADHGGQRETAQVARDVSAVTAACLLIRREVWDMVGGLSTAFPVAYNDIDLCVAVRSAGYRIVYEPHATLYHLESQTRGLDVDGSKKARLAADRERLVAKWGVLSDDPFYSPSLAVNATDGRLAEQPRIGRSWMTPPRSPHRPGGVA